MGAPSERAGAAFLGEEDVGLDRAGAGERHDAPAQEAFEPGLADTIGGGVATVMLLTVFAPLYGLVLVPAAMALFVIAMRCERGLPAWVKESATALSSVDR